MQSILKTPQQKTLLSLQREEEIESNEDDEDNGYLIVFLFTNSSLIFVFIYICFSTKINSDEEFDAQFRPSGTEIQPTGCAETDKLLEM